MVLLEIKRGCLNRLTAFKKNAIIYEQRFEECFT